MKQNAQERPRLQNGARTDSILIATSDGTASDNDRTVAKVILLDDHGERAYETEIKGNRIVSIQKVSIIKRRRSSAKLQEDYELQGYIGGTD